MTGWNMHPPEPNGIAIEGEKFLHPARIDIWHAERAQRSAYQLLGAATVLPLKLAGGIVSTLYNRSLRLRILRTELYAKVNNMHSAYLNSFY
jgi:hypothetical protein